MARILVIDDEGHHRRFYQVWLGMVGHEVVTLADPREALEAIRRERPDLLVLDVAMPYRCGPEIEQDLRVDPAIQMIPVLFLLAKCADADVCRPLWEAVRHSGRPYLSKPFSPDVLQQAVGKLLAEG